MKKKPNIILLITDQQRGDCLSIENHPVIMTPNIDSIAGNGVRFSSCYSTCPTCIASRRSLLSGQLPSTHGLVGYKEGVEWDQPTLPGVLKEAGYHTYLVGRHMHQFPERKRYGFDHMVVTKDYNEWLEKKVPEIYNRKVGQYSGMYQTSGVMHNDWTARSWHMNELYHFTNWTVNEALRFLDNRDPSCPYFLVVSFQAPHPPLTPPSFYLERYLRMDLPEPVIGDWAEPPENDGIGDDVSSSNVYLKGDALRYCRAAYYGLINHIDDQIRRILNPVNGINLARDEETIVIFTSDHGEMLGDHYLFRKTLPYEGAARIPFLIRAPEHYEFKKRLVIDKPIGLHDLMPTILDMVGLEIPDTVDGKSLLPLCRGEDVPWRDSLHIEHAPLYHCLTDGKEKYIWFVKDGREQFFDLKNDPDECHDLANDDKYKERVNHWRSLMIKELKDRPEGFSDGKKLIPGCRYDAVIPNTNRKC